jgi:hypothetical protein
MTGEIKKAGFSTAYDPLPDGDHFTFWTRCMSAREVAWMKAQARPADPDRVGFTAWTTKYAKSHWARVTHARRWGEPISIDAVRQGGRFTVTATNAAAIELPTGDAAVTASEGGAYTAQLLQNGIWRYSLEDWTPPAQAKTPDLAGPLKEALATPFIIVQGTGGDEAAQKKNKALAEHFAVSWFRFTQSPPQLTKDNLVTEKQVAECTLVLAGTPGTNAVLARLADKLPFKIDEDSVRIGDDRYDLKDHGFLLTFPSPFAPASRYVVVAAGMPWGEKLGANHKWDYVPDYCVFRLRTPEDKETAGLWAGEDQVVRAGFFGPDWKYDTKLDWKKP